MKRHSFPRSANSAGRANIVDTLVNRLRIVDYLKKHPELLERPVEAPIFVFGLPRTGTTLTINLLNADPARRCLLRWEALNSVPPAKAGELHSDPRYVAEQQKLEASIKYMPHIAAIHYEDADSPTECQYAMALSFCAQIFEANVRIPSYRDWFMKTSYFPHSASINNSCNFCRPKMAGAGHSRTPGTRSSSTTSPRSIPMRNWQ